VTRLWQNERLRNRVAENAYATAIERFSRRTSAEAFSALFADLIGQQVDQGR
jgi:hypothetical protein